MGWQLSPNVPEFVVSPASLSRQFVEQGLSLLEVCGVKALGEPAVDGCQQLACCFPLALLLPQPAQAHGRS